MRLFLLILLFIAPVVSHAETDAGTRINISATAMAELPNDEVVITFRIEQSGKDSQALQRMVNATSHRIAERLKQQSGLKRQTLGRNLQPVWQYPKNSPRIRTGWQLVQTEQVTSTELVSVPEWVQAIEDAGAYLSGLQFRISDNSARAAQSKLRTQALANFREQASELATGLDAKSFRIIRLNTSSHTPRPVMMRAEKMAVMAADDAAPAPSFSAGEGKLSLTVSGEIELPFIDYSVR